jgi:hypothetical protein
MSIEAPASRSARGTASAVGAWQQRKPLPAWPLAAFLVGVPLWWVLGLIDVIVVPVAIPMLYYLRRAGGVRVPRGFAVWFIFLFFMLASVMEITKTNSYFTFTYRASIYLASTVVFLYVYNSWQSISDRAVHKYLFGYFVTMVVGGFLGAVKPVGQFRTPMYYVLRQVAPFMVNNDLVKVMVIRPFAQYDPTGYFHVPPRPSAPFPFTNNWGNAYSLLLPLAFVFFLESRRGTRQRWVTGLLLVISAVPAMLTLNRGMFIGLAIVALFVGLRLAVRGYLGRVVLGGALAGGVALVLWNALHVSARLHTRVQASTDTRSRLYEQSLHSIGGSPIFGFGVPISSSSTSLYDPGVGTQGQFWMVLVSHGVIAVVCFVGFFALAVLMTLRRHDLPGMIYNAVILAGLIETLYYGLVPYGLPLMMIIAGLAWRPPPQERPRPAQPGVG